jgi:hypothetical protein
MATQTIIPALAGWRQETEGNPAATRPPAHSYPNLRRSFAALAFLAAVATSEALIPKFRGLLWQLPYFATPALVSAAFNYLRDLHPDRVPSILAHDAPLRLRLRRIRNALGWTALITTLLGFAIILAPSASDTCACPCEALPAPFIAWLAVDVAAFVGCIGLSSYLRERSGPPPNPSGNWSVAKNYASFKPLHSDHWGQPAR